jgi:hypothetical protein
MVAKISLVAIYTWIEIKIKNLKTDLGLFKSMIAEIVSIIK